MPILIVYATSEGHTRKVAHAAARHLTEQGHSILLVSAAEETGVESPEYERALLFASVHQGHYQSEFIAIVRRLRGILQRVPTAFFSVSLSAVSPDQHDRDSLEEVVINMIRETGWSPGQIVHVGGALRTVRQDFLKRWALRWLAAHRAPPESSEGEAEYTDWRALYTFLDTWTNIRTSVP